MSDLRTAAQQALEALEKYRKMMFVEAGCRFGEGDAAITALRAALAQEQAEPNAYGYASRLAVAIWEKHYKDTAPNWKPLDDLIGVLTQIDNMTSGLTRHEQAEPAQEPAEPFVVRHYIADDRPCIKGNGFDGLTVGDDREEADRFVAWINARISAPPKAEPLPLKTVERLIYENTKINPNVADDRELLGYIVNAVRAVERAHGIGDNT